VTLNILENKIVKHVIIIEDEGGHHMIILASRSPRRAVLMKEAGLDFIVEPSDIEEFVDENLDPKDIVVELARLKATHVALKYPDDIVIGADTIVVHDDEVLGKPIDEIDAERMLKKLSNDKHTVYTAVYLVKSGMSKTILSSADVWMKQLSELEIRNYIKTNEPMDKAGAYAIQGEGGSLVDHYKGDFFTIVGLPLKDLLEALKTFN